ncbi:hypothetical protein RUE5091_02302 [Ruegeria denitrificans]|uniref:Uncharacterized protein n=1 Tax=Ruegeria denitrificans TaxID=1715692 RepID=A0A0P1IAN5_9RHOB|nr:hypothetical protein RUE5091_02302 [Ruegeria denitrificans]
MGLLYSGAPQVDLTKKKLGATSIEVSARPAKVLAEPAMWS